MLEIKSVLEQVLWWVISRLNAEMEKREWEKEEKWTVSLQPASTQEPKKFLRDKWAIY